MSQISTILTQIPREQRASFDRAALTESINRSPRTRPGSGDELPFFTLSQSESEPSAALVVATGPGVEQYADAIDNLLKRRSLSVIEYGSFLQIDCPEIWSVV